MAPRPGRPPVSSRTPLHGGIIVATIWIILNLMFWTAVAVSTLFLSALLIHLVMLPLTTIPTT